jgi:DNA-binding PucR family transcriptional regulator
VAYFGTLGAYRVLAATDPAELAGFRAETLGPLLGPDERGSADLLRTLEAYLACGGSPQETAQRLHTHRNTVLYRLQRIGDLLGTDVRSPETQFTLWLALRAAEVLGDPAASTPGKAGAAAEAVTAAASARRTRRAA